MKLRNKKTGEIVELDHISAHYSRHYDYGEGRSGEQPCSTWNHSLAELNEEWEDYEEPIKPYWFINDLDGEPMKCDLKNCGKSNFIKWSEHRKQIGNYFETKEDAEKAVDKLKAWKRLKDKGFRFSKDWEYRYDQPKVENHTYFEMVAICEDGIRFDDLDLLFGGEDE